MCNCSSNGSSSSNGKLCRNCIQLEKEIKAAKDKLDAIKRNVAKSRNELAALDAKEARLNFLMKNMAMFGKTKKK